MFFPPMRTRNVGVVRVGSVGRKPYAAVVYAERYGLFPAKCTPAQAHFLMYIHLVCCRWALALFRAARGSGRP